MKLFQLIQQLNLNWVSPDITEKNFPLEKNPGKVSKIFQFDTNLSSNDVVKHIGADGHRPATLQELLLWDLENWDGGNPVVALGSVWSRPGGDRFVPCLGGGGSLRTLLLYWWTGHWVARYRFAAVAKQPELTTSESQSLALESSALPVVKYVLSSRAVDTLKQAQVEMEQYRQHGTLKPQTRIYEVTAVYQPKLERVAYAGEGLVGSCESRDTGDKIASTSNMTKRTILFGKQRDRQGRFMKGAE